MACDIPRMQDSISRKFVYLARRLQYWMKSYSGFRRLGNHRMAMINRLPSSCCMGSREPENPPSLTPSPQDYTPWNGSALPFALVVMIESIEMNPTCLAPLHEVSLIWTELSRLNSLKRLKILVYAPQVRIFEHIGMNK